MIISFEIIEPFFFFHLSIVLQVSFTVSLLLTYVARNSTSIASRIMQMLLFVGPGCSTSAGCDVSA